MRKKKKLDKETKLYLLIFTSRIVAEITIAIGFAIVLFILFRKVFFA